MSNKSFFENNKTLNKNSRNIGSSKEVSTKDEIEDTDDEIYKIELVSNIKTEEVGEEYSQKPSRKLYIISVLIIMLIFIVSGVFFLLKTNTSNEPQDKEMIFQPTEYVNNSNYIKVDRTTSIDNQIINISRVLVDSMATIIRFKDSVDLTNLEISIIDDNNNEFYLDYKFYNPDEELVIVDSLRFEPFEGAIEKFAVKILNTSSQTEKKIEFVFGKDFSMPLAKKINFANIVIEDDLVADRMDFSIDQGIFTSSGSTIEYSIKSKKLNTYIDINLNPTEKMISLDLIEGAKTISSDKKNFVKQGYSSSESTTYGRIDFDPIKNLDSKLRLVIDEIYSRSMIDTVIDARELLRYENNPEESLDFEDYTLVLERMKLYSNKYVLVAHAVDKNLEQTSQHSNRVKMDMNIQLMTKNIQGEDVYLEGIVYSSNKGTDISFEFNGIEVDGNSQVYLKIDSVSFKLPPVSVSIELAE